MSTEQTTKRYVQIVMSVAPVAKEIPLIVLRVQKTRSYLIIHVSEIVLQNSFGWTQLEFHATPLAKLASIIQIIVFLAWINHFFWIQNQVFAFVKTLAANQNFMIQLTTNAIHVILLASLATDPHLIIVHPVKRREYFPIISAFVKITLLTA